LHGLSLSLLSLPRPVSLGGPPTRRLHTARPEQLALELPRFVTQVLREICNTDPGFLPEISIGIFAFPLHEDVQRAAAPSLVSAHRHDATHRPSPSIVRLLTSDDRAHGDTLSNLPPRALHLLPAALSTLWIPSWFNFESHRFAHVHRLVPTQSVAGGSLLRAVEQLSDPNEVTESQIVNSKRFPFASAEDLLECKEGPQPLVTKLESLLRLGLRKNEPLGAVRPASPSAHAIPLSRKRPISPDPVFLTKAKVKRSPPARA
jgi:hypothetical protein